MSQRPVLYYSPLSPPSNAVLLTAAELGVELELKIVNLLEKDHLKSDFVKVVTYIRNLSLLFYWTIIFFQFNAQHTIPVLEDNGLKLVDSHVICGYLVDKYGTNDKLYPKDVEKRALVDSRLYYEAANVFCRLRFLMEPVFYEKSTDWPEWKIKYIQKVYEVLDRFVSETPYMCGNDLTIADFSLISSISSGNIVAPIDSVAYPYLLKWIHRISRLPYYEEKNGSGGKIIQELVLDLVKKNAAL